MLVDTPFFLKIVPEVVLSCSIPPCADRDTPRLSDVENFMRSRCNVRVEASYLTPAHIVGSQIPPVHLSIRSHDV